MHYDLDKKELSDNNSIKFTVLPNTSSCSIWITCSKDLKKSTIMNYYTSFTDIRSVRPKTIILNNINDDVYKRLTEDEVDIMVKKMRDKTPTLNIQ